MIRLIKLLIIVFAMNFTVGCANIASDTISDYFLSNEKNKEVIRQYYNESEYSFAVFKFGRFGPDTILVLAFIKDGIYEWRSSDGISVFTNNGMIVQTLGLGKDVTSSIDINTFYPGMDDVSSTTTFYNPLLFNALTQNKFTYSQDVYELDILGKPLPSNMVTQEIVIPSIKWNKKNKYFTNIDGNVIKAEIYIHPKLPKLTIDYFYK